MEFKDYYTTLGVTKASSEKEIKQAFRKLARKHHPDVNPGDKAAETTFKEINEAYEVLGDPAKRKKYDELGSNWRAYEQAEARGEANPFAGQWDVDFARRRRRRRWRQRRLPHDDAGRDGGDVRGLEPVLRFLHHVLRRRRRAASSAARAGARAAARGSARAATSSTRWSSRSRRRTTAAPRRLSMKHDGQARTVDVRIPAGRHRRLARARVRRRRARHRRRASQAISTCASGFRRTRSSSARAATSTSRCRCR